MNKTVKILIHIFSPFLLIFLGIIGFWFYQEKTTLKIEEAVQISQEKQECPEQSPLTKPEEATEPVCQPEVNLPIVVYEPGGLFTEEEKENLQKYLVNPYFDYHNEKEITYISMHIQKLTDGDYDYEIFNIHKNGGYASFLFDKNKYWFPECMDPCPFSEDFKNKYPQIIQMSNP